MRITQKVRDYFRCSGPHTEMASPIEHERMILVKFGGEEKKGDRGVILNLLTTRVILSGTVVSLAFEERSMVSRMSNLP